MPAQAQRQILARGTHTGVGRARGRKSRYQQLRSWWTAYTAARQEAYLTSLRTCWNATRESVTPFRAEAASEMAQVQGVCSTAGQLYGLALSC
jgi:hypothetical protein